MFSKAKTRLWNNLAQADACVRLATSIRLRQYWLTVHATATFFLRTVVCGLK